CAPATAPVRAPDARSRPRDWPHKEPVRGASRRPTCQTLSADSSSLPVRWCSVLRRYPDWLDLAKRESQPVFPWSLADRAVAWLHLLLYEHRGCEFHPLPSVLDSRSQKQRPKMLLHRARADGKLAGNLFVAAPLHQQP